MLELSQEQSFVVAARHYQQGYTVIPAALGSKVPCVKYKRYSRTVERPSLHTLGQWFPSGAQRNIGLLGGHASGGLAFLDNDSPQALDGTEHYLDGLGIHNTTMHRRDPTGSTHDGGGTFWIKTDPPARSGGKGDLDVQADRGLVFVPWSKHPDGPIYQFGSWLDVLPVIGLRDLAGLVPLEPAPAPWPKLSSYAWLLVDGYPKEENAFRSRSEREQALANCLALAGCSWRQAVEIFTELLPEHSKYKTKLARRGAKHATDEYLAVTWESAQTFTKKPNEAQQTAQAVRAWALSRAWPGRSGPTDKAVLLAHCELSESCAKSTYHASCRTLAELAGVGLEAASHANGRLVKDGALVLERRAEDGKATVYSLGSGLKRTFSQHVPSMENVRFSPHEHARHDVWRRDGFGKAGWDVWDALGRVDRASVAELQEATGRCTRTVGRKLAAFAECDMVVRIGRGDWTPRTDVDLDKVAEALGTAGIGARQKERHGRQRIANAVELRTGRRSQVTLTHSEREQLAREQRRRTETELQG